MGPNPFRFGPFAGYVRRVRMRCFMFRYALGDVVRWYEAEEDGLLREACSIALFPSPFPGLQPAARDGLTWEGWLLPLIESGDVVELS